MDRVVARAAETGRGGGWKKRTNIARRCAFECLVNSVGDTTAAQCRARKIVERRYIIVISNRARFYWTFIGPSFRGVT